mgnify:CR=1 FL=1
MDKSIVVPIGLFVAVVYSLKLLVDARMRYLFFKGGAPDTVEALFRGEERLRRQAGLRWGVVLCALAAGLGVAQAVGFQTWSVGGLATVLAAIGLGQLAAYALARHLDPLPIAPTPDD